MKKEYTVEEAVERLAAFDALGLEPDEIRTLLPKHFKRKPVIRGPWIANTDTPISRRLTLRMSYDCPNCRDEGSTYSLALLEKSVDMRYNGSVLMDDTFNPSSGWRNPPDNHECYRCGQLIDWDDFDPQRDLNNAMERMASKAI